MPAWIRVFWQLQLASWKQQLAYPTVFWFGFSAKVVRIGLAFLVFSALTASAVSLGGFEQWDVYVHMLTAAFSTTIVAALFQRNLLHRLSKLIRKGDLDLMLVKPISPLFHVAVSVGDLFDLITMIPVTGVLVWSVWRLESVTLSGVLLYGASVVVGIVMMAALTIFFSSMLFKVVQGSGITRVMREATRSTQYPVTAFGPTMSKVFLFILPFGFLATVPVGLLVGLFEWWVLPVTALLSFVMFALSVRTWNWALNRVYSSASS